MGLISSKDYAGGITYIVGEIKRKGPGEFYWETLDKKSQLYWNDSIFAGKNSKVDIELKESGIKVSLNQKSNVIIEKIKGRSTLNLLEGTLLTDLTHDSELDLMLGKDNVVSLNLKNLLN